MSPAGDFVKRELEREQDVVRVDGVDLSAFLEDRSGYPRNAEVVLLPDEESGGIELGAFVSGEFVAHLNPLRVGDTIDVVGDEYHRRFAVVRVDQETGEMDLESTDGDPRVRLENVRFGGGSS